MIVVEASAALELLLRPATQERMVERLLGTGELLVAPHLLDLDATGDADVAGLVQGERLIADVLRGASNGTTTISLPARSLPAGDWVTVTATATRPGEAGSTSCFSKAVRVP